MNVVTGSISAVLWFVTFLYLVTRPENQRGCRDGVIAVIFAIPSAVVAALITVLPLMIAQNFCAFSNEWFAVLATSLITVLYWKRAWIKKILDLE